VPGTPSAIVITRLGDCGGGATCDAAAHDLHVEDSHMLRALLLSLVLCATVPAAAQMTPPRGSPLRAQLMDTLRPTVMAEIGGSIEFVVTDLRVMGQWAYAYVRPQRPGGTPIDWNRTKYRQDMAQGTMSDGVMALLRHDGARWQVIECAIGPSDVAWDGWRQERSLPRQLFTDQ
jgi:hypothetical protein